ncbi:MAG: hypothetical protein FJ147_17160 [Deltaproteobacteria bacterium]|nr:hypothetical protein [Deltaproteobacteria bacterium]
MKAKVHKLISTAMLGLALFSHSLPAWAGASKIDRVFISSNGTVSGSLPGARYSGDDRQYIGCSHYRHSVNPNSFAWCSAQDKAGKTVLCTSFDPRIVDAVKGMTDSSHLTFRLPNLYSQTCTDLTISNESIYLR